MKYSAKTWVLIAGCALLELAGCSGQQPTVRASGTGEDNTTTVGITSVKRQPLSRNLTLSSELVPYQEIDVYAKEAGFVKELLVDYGSRVEKGQLLAVLDIPELELQLHQDNAVIESATDAMTQSQHVVDQLQAQHDTVHKNSERLANVDKSRPGLVAQQELDDANAKDMASGAQVEAAKSAYQTAKGQLDQSKAKLERDKALFEYARITAPFAGVVTQRFANFGTLMQAGTNSSTQALPLVKLSEDDKFRLVIPVPESYVKFIHINDPVQVRVASLNRTVPGEVKRFSMDLASETRTMHTEVDVPNPKHQLMAGMYAEATISLERKNGALVLPPQAISQNNGQANIYLVDANDTLQERKITLGLQTPTDVEVLSGLNEGDRVVITDRSGLKAGMHVRPQEIEAAQYQGGNSQ